MTKLQLWCAVTLIVAVLAAFAVILGPELPPLSIEILGSLTGVFLALGAQEIIQLLADRKRANVLRGSLIAEIEDVRGHLDAGAFRLRFDCPVWTYAKNSGELGLLLEEEMFHFGGAYSLIELHNEEARFIDQADAFGNDRLVKFLRQRQKEIDDLLTLRFQATLVWYKLTYGPTLPKTRVSRPAESRPAAGDPKASA